MIRRLRPRQFALFFFILAASLPAATTHARDDSDRNLHLRYIDLDRTLFGVEYTFQDQGMVDEPGRMTMETPHKRKKFEAFKRAYLEQLGLDKRALGSFGLRNFKPGETISVPADGKHVMNMEPVTIEVNTPPRHLGEIKSSATPIFHASEEATLLPYVNPVAERSGMGHIHVGAATIGESPFYRNPQLLRNMMVYEHKHPSVLWGFAEAFDIDDIKIPTGNDVTNIETYHKPGQQSALARAIEKFDAWYKNALAGKADLSDGLRKFLQFLKAENSQEVDFFHHYRFMNLEHLEFIANSPVPIDPRTPGKATVEFRNFRPPGSPAHAEANAELLVAMMESNAKPGFLQKFETISPADYDRFHSATYAAGDWEKVKADLPFHNPLWDESMNEYTRLHLSVAGIKAKLPAGVQGEIYPAYSPKRLKGTKFELRIRAKDELPAPVVEIEGKPLSFAEVQVHGKNYWVGTFDASTNPTELKLPLKSLAAKCSSFFKLLGVR